MNWFQKTCSKDSILKELKNRGWTQDQTISDGLKIWKNDNKFLCSLGDWSQIPCNDVVNSVKHLYPNAEIECDAECGAPDGWKEII